MQGNKSGDNGTVSSKDKGLMIVLLARNELKITLIEGDLIWQMQSNIVRNFIGE